MTDDPLDDLLARFHSAMPRNTREAPPPPPPIEFAPEYSGWHPVPGLGEIHRYRFPNGYLASVVRGPVSYGGSEGMWECMTLTAAGDTAELPGDPPNPIGYLNDSQLAEYLVFTASLPPMNGGDQ